jgi:hypothetical protein
MMSRSFRLLFCILLAARLSAVPPTLFGASSAEKQSASDIAAGTWVGAAELNGKQVPFRLELRGTGENVQ